MSPRCHAVPGRSVRLQLGCSATGPRDGVIYMSLAHSECAGALASAGRRCVERPAPTLFSFQRPRARGRIPALTRKRAHDTWTWPVIGVQLPFG
jgi:hypothetical protein